MEPQFSDAAFMPSVISACIIVLLGWFGIAIFAAKVLIKAITNIAQPNTNQSSNIAAILVSILCFPAAFVFAWEFSKRAETADLTKMLLTIFIIMGTVSVLLADAIVIYAAVIFEQDIFRLLDSYGLMY